MEWHRYVTLNIYVQVCSHTKKIQSLINSNKGDILTELMTEYILVHFVLDAYKLIIISLTHSNYVLENFADKLMNALE